MSDYNCDRYQKERYSGRWLLIIKGHASVREIREAFPQVASPKPVVQERKKRD